MASVHLVSVAGLVQEIETRSHTLIADEPENNGGTDRGPAPYELLLASLAACTSATLRLYCGRKGWELGRIEIEARFLRDAEGVEKIRREISFSQELSEEQRERLADICEKTPVTKTLKRGTTILTTLHSSPVSA